ncbi:MAG: hypothetical protein J5930_03735 [Treponema sp.]|nr:hypothetical protein [Treponema sp.]
MKRFVFFFFVVISLFVPLLFSSCAAAFINPGSGTTGDDAVVTGGVFTSFMGDEAFVQNMKRTVLKEPLSSGREYYVSAAGSDSNAGTREKPFKTFSLALSKLNGGGILYVEDGAYSGPVYIESSDGGNAENYLTIKAVNPGGAVFSADGRALFEIAGSYVKLEGLSFSDCVGAGSCGVSLAAGANHVIISGCVFKNINVDSNEQDDCANGILLYGTSAEMPVSNVFIRAEGSIPRRSASK